MFWALAVLDTTSCLLKCMHPIIYLYRCSTGTQYLQCRYACPTVAPTRTGTGTGTVPGTHSADMSDTLCMNSFASFCGGTGCSVALGVNARVGLLHGL